MTGRETPEAREPIEDYLDELLGVLRLPPRATRRLLAETEDHLRQAADDLQRAGCSRVDAEREAVHRFGPPARIAAAERAARRPSPGQLLVALAWAGVALGGIGLTAVGVSGGLAVVFNVAVGRRFVGALPASYGPMPCDHFLSIHPGAPSCAVAAVLENSADAVSLRLLAGVLGILLLALAWTTRRFLTGDVSHRHVLYAAVWAAAAASFGLATFALAGMSANTAMQYGSGGVGWFLSGGIVSALGTALSGCLTWRFARRVRGTPLLWQVSR